MNTHALHDLLTTKLGLDPDAVGPSFLTMVARRSVAKSGQADLDSFVDAARHGGEAWEILLDQVLVLETWFFRDRATFETLPSLVRHRWRGPGSAPVRLLSWPCSTGEEPYSVAIALSEAGLPREAFTIDAADVSPQAIAAARAGIYGPRSFRGAGPWHRSPYFEHAEGRGHWRVTPAYRSMVEFRRANLVSLHGLAPAARYDVVLCRNVLIYLHAEARARVMRTLGSLLEPGGVLIVGHAEAGIALEHGFRVHGAPEAFAFVSAAPGAEGSKAARAGDGSASPGRRKTPPDRKSTRLNASHVSESRMPSSA